MLKPVGVTRFSRFGLIFALVAAFWLYIFVAAIHAVMPTNPISALPLSKELYIASWFPQGWGFYSKDARDLTFQVVDITNGTLAAAWPNNRSENFFGLKRFGRSQGIEAGLLSSRIPESAKTDCEENPYACLNKAAVYAELDNPTPYPTICGDIGFVYQEPVPWAWSRSGKKIDMPSKVVRVNVKCSKN